MKQIVQNFKLRKGVNVKLMRPHGKANGSSASPKHMIFDILPNNLAQVKVLDIGFGAGNLGQLIKANQETDHWEVDGIDGWEPNCFNLELINKKIYHNIYHGTAQELSFSDIANYKIICLLDVIEHLDVDAAKSLVHLLLSSLGEHSFLFISTPLWFYPQDQIQDGDLEEHLIGVSAASMMSLLPLIYAINEPLVGGFVYGKRSLEYIDFFEPTPNKNFSKEMGTLICRSLNIDPNSRLIHAAGIKLFSILDLEKSFNEAYKSLSKYSYFLDRIYIYGNKILVFDMHIAGYIIAFDVVVSGIYIDILMFDRNKKLDLEAGFSDFKLLEDRKIKIARILNKEMCDDNAHHLSVEIVEAIDTSVARLVDFLQ